MSSQEEGTIGKPVTRVDAWDKVTGRARYADDVSLPGMLHCAVVRSHESHGELLGLIKDEDFDWSSVVLVTPGDIKGTNFFDMHDKKMPVLATGEVLYKGQPIALVAAKTPDLAKEAAAGIRGDIRSLPAVHTLTEVVAQYKNNSPELFRHCSKTIKKGDIEKGFAAADYIIEGEYWMGHQEQLYLEPNTIMAVPEADGGVLVQGSLQCPYYVVNEAAEGVGLTKKTLRCRQTVVGGAFGGKEEFPSLIGAYVTLLALKAGKPVKLCYDRHEDILYSTKRHPAWIRHKTGLKKDGSITAMRVDYLLDGGAYLTISDVVMFRGILHAALVYRCENVFVDGLVVRTNTFPDGGFRGFGAPQAIYALETHVEKLARACGIPPHEFRLKNALRLNDTTPTGQLLRDPFGSPAVIEQAIERSSFSDKLARSSRGKGSGPLYGIGMSFYAHGSAFTGEGEVKIGTTVLLELERPDGGKPKAVIRVSSTEMGQGSLTVLSQMTADGLGVGLDYVSYPLPDTRLVPDSGPTVASRTTMVVGSCLNEAALDMKKTLEEFAAVQVFESDGASLENGRFRSVDGREKPFDEVAVLYLELYGPMRVYKKFALPEWVSWDQETFRGDAYPGYSWGCNIAEVEVDPLTLEIRVTRVTGVFDIGRVINPTLALGQLEGGLTQALGYAVMEKMSVVDGIFDANRLQTYIIPTALDVPEFDLAFVEYPYPHAAVGAKGVGEMSLDGLAPAIGNAVAAATGLNLNELPVTPEKLYELLKGQ